SDESESGHWPFAGKSFGHDEELDHGIAGDDGRRDEPIYATTPSVRRRWRGPDARDTGFGQSDGLGHQPPAGKAQGARRDAGPGIQKENGHGATRRGGSVAAQHSAANAGPAENCRAIKVIERGIWLGLEPATARGRSLSQGPFCINTRTIL